MSYTCTKAPEKYYSMWLLVLGAVVASSLVIVRGVYEYEQVFEEKEA